MNGFPLLNLPPCDLDFRPDADSRRGVPEVYDMLRRKWVSLTPEEWVRQNFVRFLIEHRSFRPALMANEVALKLNGTSRRADTLVYDKTLRHLAVVEYKAPEVAVTQKVFDQIARYNSVLGAHFLIVSNGLVHYCCQYTGGGYVFLRDIPTYDAMVGACDQKK